MGGNKQRLGGLISFVFLLLLIYLALVPIARGEDRALLVGVGRYAHFDEKLKGVSLDIQMMTEFARIMGFKHHAIKVLEHEAASTDNVYSAIENWLINGVGPQDRVFFYFSGHGSQIPDLNGDEKDQFDEVLLLYDVALREKDRHKTLTGVLPDDDFNAMLARMQSRNIFVVLDACHSGSATRSLKLNSRSLALSGAQVKFFSYSPVIGAAGGQGSFDVMEPQTSVEVNDRYVALTACRDDEKTVATSQGSIFTLGLRQVVQAAAAAGINLTPEDLKHQTTLFIRDQIQSDAIAFHPQIAGNIELQQRPLKLFTPAEGRGIVQQEMEMLVYKSNQTVRMKLNKSCFESGDALEISLWIPEPGYLNIISINTHGEATVLFPNQYHPGSSVKRGKMTLPGDHMSFEMVTDGQTGPHQIAAFLTRSPVNAYENGFKTPANVLARLSPKSTRSLVLRQKQGWLAAGRVTADILNEGQCR
ncbi:MAG: caspase family protein [Desulfobacterales bacterium]